MNKIGRKEKIIGMRIATIASGLYAVEYTREFLQSILEFNIAGISVSTAVGVVAIVFAVGHWKSRW